MSAPEDVNVDDLRRRARRRLVGAIVLALAAAVFVPMLLESEPKPLGEDVSVKIPPVDDAKFVNKLNDKGKPAPPKAEAKAPEPRVEDKPDAAKADAAPPAKSEPVPAVDAPKPEPAKAEPPKAEAKSESRPEPKAEPRVEPKGDTKVETKSEPKAEPPKDVAKADGAADPKGDAKAAAAVPKNGAANGAAHEVASGFSVQLAAFSDNYGANALSNKLKKLGYPAYTEPLQTSRGTLYRVRVGPFATREAAGTSRDKLKAEGYAGIVAPSK